MTENQAGVTALITAYSRAYHATMDSPKVFDDFLADQLFTKEEHIQFNQNLAELLNIFAPELAAQHPDQATALAWVMQHNNGPITLSRSRYTEDCLDEALRTGVQQYVILGAGMDTFAFRRPELARRLQIFEVDHPVTQEIKRQRIAAAGWQIPPNLHFIPINFSTDTLESALKNSSFETEKDSFFSWLGVSFYLSLADIEKTLKAIVQITPARSQVVFDYLDIQSFEPGKASKPVQFLQAIAQQVGEPLKTGFNPAALASELKLFGLSLMENLGPVEIEESYFQNRTDQYHAFPQIHFARASVL